MAATSSFALTFISLLLLPYFSRGNGYFSLLDFGARPGGRSDSSAALQTAWSAACSSVGAATIHVPAGRFLVATPTVFRGSCKTTHIDFRIDGVLAAPSDFRQLSAATALLSFEDVAGVTISGGVLDGQGAGLWACKGGHGKNCPNGARTLVFTHSRDISIYGLTSLNSQLYHIVFDGCTNVNVQGVRVSASGRSPNTDGIHVQGSTGVTILNTRISTGDDCVSVGPGTTNLWIENMACGPGHGISIGSLGKDANEAGVQNVTVKTVVFTNTENGVRIKSWARPSTGFVRNVLFQHATMVNVQNPIIINQHYCDTKDCPESASGVRISDVTYQDIHGSSATQVAVKLDCSSKYPCTGLRMEDVRLSFKDQRAKSSCDNAEGSAHGVVQPATNCL